MDYSNDSGGPMATALAAARAAAAAGEVPVGAAVVAADGAILAVAGNRVMRDHDPTGHAEILALRQAAATRGDARLPDCDLYVTLEPCPMCAQAISFARIRRLRTWACSVSPWDCSSRAISDISRPCPRTSTRTLSGTPSATISSGSERTTSTQEARIGGSTSTLC